MEFGKGNATELNSRILQIVWTRPRIIPNKDEPITHTEIIYLFSIGLKIGLGIYEIIL